jgi:thiamine phosphate synthase YjbQ (UPF0047 family)
MSFSVLTRELTVNTRGKGTYEGPDDSPSLLRMALTRTSEVIPVQNGQPVLGTWRGFFLFDHCLAPHTRKVTLSLIGTTDPS